MPENTPLTISFPTTGLFAYVPKTVNGGLASGFTGYMPTFSSLHWTPAARWILVAE